MAGKPKRKAFPSFDIPAVKTAAAGRWIEVAQSVFGIDSSYLTGIHGPCPRSGCDGKDRWRVYKDFNETGGAICNTCSDKMGDGIELGKWILGKEFPEVLRLVAEYLRVEPSDESRPAPKKSARGGVSTNGHSSAAAAPGKTKNKSPAYADLQSAVAGYKSWLLKKDEKLTIESKVTGWTYQDQFGCQSYVVIRYETNDGKRYAPFHQDVDQWRLGDPDGVLLPLFNLPALAAPTPADQTGQGAAAAADSPDLPPIYIVEGEKTSEALQSLGLISTTSAHGAKSPQKTDWSPVAGRRLIALPDNDRPGEGYIRAVAEIVRGLDPPATITIRRLPDLADGEDIFDFIEQRKAAGKSADQIRLEIESLPDEIIRPAKKRSAGDALSNAEWVDSDETTDDGEAKRKLNPLPMLDVLDNINERTDGWPRRVDNTIFIHANSGISLLESTSKLFGWLGSRTGVIQWHRSTGCVTKEEVHAELCRTAERYLAIEELPHEPAIQGHYYACNDIPLGNGAMLSKFLDFFSPETTIDRDLIKAALMTCFWGGPGGLRPCFVITSSDGCGAGKSTLAAKIGRIAGGLMSFDRHETASEIKTRLLSPDALMKRVALLDNIKSLKFGWGELEGLITSSTISGKRMYVGEGVRPNTLTWFLTLNGASLSQDMAQRSVVIKVTKPDRGDSWDEDTNLFIDQHRYEIIGDLLAILKGKTQPLTSHTRWAMWERSVLCRLADPSAAQQLIEERQDIADTDKEENELIEECFAHNISLLYGDPDRQCVFIPSHVAAEWLNRANNERQSVTAVSRQLKRMIQEKRMKSLGENHGNALGRGFIWSGSYVATVTPSRDLVRKMCDKKAQDQEAGKLF
jgi:hypothetical protein